MRYGPITSKRPEKRIAGYDEDQKQAVRNLHTHGAYLIALGKGSGKEPQGYSPDGGPRPIYDTPLTMDEVEHWLSSGGAFGIESYSVGIMPVDKDEGDVAAETVFTEIFPTDWWYESHTKGRGHGLFRRENDDRRYKKADQQFDGFKAQCRWYRKSYMMMYDPGVWWNAICNKQALPVVPDDFEDRRFSKKSADKNPVDGLVWPISLLRWLLDGIDPDGEDMSRNERVRVAFAIQTAAPNIQHQHESELENLYYEWLDRRTKRANPPDDARRKAEANWRSAVNNSDGRVTLGTLFHLAGRKRRDIPDFLSQSETASVVEQPVGRHLVTGGEHATSLQAVLDHKNTRIVLNERAGWYEYSTDGGETWNLWEQHVEADFLSDMERQYMILDNNCDTKPFRVLSGSGICRQMFNTVFAKNSVDPFVEYLENLPPTSEMDKPPCGIDDILSHLFKAQDSDINRFAARSLFLGALDRAYNPGCKLDHMIVLMDDSGNIGKSIFVEKLVPEPTWTTDTSFVSDTKKMAEALQGRVFVEYGELDGMGKTPLNKLKQFISKTDDGSVRLAYRRDPYPLKRRCVLIGTTNEREIFAFDSAGYRRFVVVECFGRMDDAIVPWMDRYRDYFWSEALEMYRNGERASVVPSELTGVQQRTNSRFTRSDALCDLIDDFHAKIIDEGRQFEDISVNEIVHHITPHWTNGSDAGWYFKDYTAKKRLSNSLKHRGWEPLGQKMKKGTRLRYWKAPPFDGDKLDEAYTTFEPTPENKDGLTAEDALSQDAPF